MKIMFLGKRDSAVKAGFVGEVTPEYGRELIEAGKAKEYNGKYPPQGKHKFELSQLKKQ